MRACLALMCVLSFAAVAVAEEAYPYAPSVVPGERWKDLQLKVVKPKGEHDLIKALDQAKREGKFTFIQLGRQNCTNTMQLWHMLADGSVKLPENFIYADISRDDDVMRQAFEERFTMDEFSGWLPFVVIVGPDGVQLESCSGRHTAQEYTALIEKSVADYNAYVKENAPSEPAKPFAESLIPTPKGCEQLAVKKLPGEHDLAKAMEQAKAQGKFLFIQYGRTNCTNCQKVWNLLGSGAVKLPEDFLYADVSCDDEATRMLFESTISVTDDGYLYPYIVILGPDGYQLAFRSGLGTAEDYRAMIEQARKDYATPLP